MATNDGETWQHKAGAASGARRQGDVAVTRSFHARPQVQLRLRQGGLKCHGLHLLFDPAQWSSLCKALSKLITLLCDRFDDTIATGGPARKRAV
jgi:hypothetical protein